MKTVLNLAGWKTCDTAGKNACATGGVDVQIDRNFLSLTVLN